MQKILVIHRLWNTAVKTVKAVTRMFGLAIKLKGLYNLFEFDSIDLLL